ncbi:MAG: HAD family hydrolase [Verrucomicrobiota bacterium]
MSITRTLLIDADDTLWENNIYFERVAQEFFAKVAEAGVTEQRAQSVLWQIEQRNIQTTGYGSQAFCASLHQAALELGAMDLEPWIKEREQWIFQHPIELMPGVADALPKLRHGNRLILLTKGQPAEQLGKLRRSNLEPCFHATEVVFEKNVNAYRDVVVKHGLEVSQTWMIGNSPRSDINPAKAAGLHTVFIPYHTTWQHELEEIALNGSETLLLENFGKLLEHFA